MEQYFKNAPVSKDREFSFEYVINNEKFKFYSNNGVFSKKDVDFGTNLMLQTFLDNENEDAWETPKAVLDCGCGLGVVGVVIGKLYKKAQVTMLDINQRAVDLSLKNLKVNGISDSKVLCSNLFEKVNQMFDYILSNPPIRAGKEVVFTIYEESYAHLEKGGSLYVVIQKKQGAQSTENKLNEIFNNCTIINKNAGYRIFKCIK